MNFTKAIEYLVKHARYSNCDCGISSTTLEDACVVVDQFLRYLPTEFTNDAHPNMQKINGYSHFYDDDEKMLDFNHLSKDQFLKSYSYINESEYNLTRIKQREEEGYK